MKTNYKGITGTQLKLIGVFLMVLDHIHQMFYYAGAPMILTMLGRLVLPIFLFMLAEGFHYTRNKHKYLARLFIAHVIMMIMTQIITRIFPLDTVILMNGIFGTMFLGALTMFAYDKFRECRYLLGTGLLVLPVVPAAVGMLLSNSHPMLAATIMIDIPNYLAVEGGFVSVFLALGLYIFREKRSIQYLLIAIVALISTNFQFNSTLLTENVQWMMVFSIIPISFYNGQRGKGSKYFFYIFYPAHIYILYILSYLYTNYFM
ncbi:hypothetical protein BG262_05085 [Floricoccus penangensis]|uniref:TraX protein n=1 Tax=Floricoccus penangensis TaxID=1859475 RepID=A0A9Q5JGC9_9LACT|nr:TraX family protein [Floricoccus penangensis]OFI46392.1 hypothetical protein BG262_05085 [Floricoccus penangensis]